MTFFVALSVIAILLVLMYNSLITKKNQVENIFAGVDAVLKKRYDLIPNLVSSVSEYMNFEKSVLEKITQLRAEAGKTTLSENDKIRLDAQISSALGSVMVAVENYPDLKSNSNIMNLQHNLTEIESQISAARRAYNQAVTDYNNALEMFPTNFMASLMHLQKKEVFSITKDERENVNVGKLFHP